VQADRSTGVDGVGMGLLANLAGGDVLGWPFTLYADRTFDRRCLMA